MSVLIERGYLDEPYRRAFDAAVVLAGSLGGQPAVRLERTWFYPEGGGQPADRGTIGEARVLDVQGDADGVWHVLDRPLAPGTYAATLDFERRFDHMQQHSGQHLLSRAFFEVCGAETVSFHLGDRECSIDLDIESIDDAVVTRTEELAQRIVFENRAVSHSLVEHAAARAMGVDVPDKATAAVRVVEIADFDLNACGGTHVTATGEIGPIKLTRRERVRGGVRVGFLCGGRAMRDYAFRHRTLRELALALTTGEDEVAARCLELSREVRDLDKRLRALRGELAGYQAAEVRESGTSCGAVRIVHRVVESSEVMRPLGQALAAIPGTVSLLGATGKPCRLLFTRSDDVAVDLGVVLRGAAARLGGRGGGKPAWAEGAGPDESALEVALEEAMRAVQSAIDDG